MQIAGLNPPAVPLQTDIALARSWADLEVLCERIDAAYRDGAIDLASAESLSAMAALTAAKVPEAPSIPAEALVGPAVCDCCGATIEGAICADPIPALQLDSRQAA